MDNIRCSSETCRKENDQEIFNITVTVNADRSLAETVERIPAESFTCAFCNTLAEVVPETKEETF